MVRLFLYLAKKNSCSTPIDLGCTAGDGIREHVLLAALKMAYDEIANEINFQRGLER